jgi:hypothetical protein
MRECTAGVPGKMMKWAADVLGTFVVSVKLDFKRCKSQVLPVYTVMSVPTAAFEGKQLLKKFMLRTAVRPPPSRVLLCVFHRDVFQVLRLYRSLCR